jgi:hypothetical protein
MVIDDESQRLAQQDIKNVCTHLPGAGPDRTPGDPAGVPPDQFVSTPLFSTPIAKKPTMMEQQLGYGPRPGRTPTSSRSPSPVASWLDERLPRAHDRRGWRSRAPWRHADGVRSRWRRDECGGARCVGAPCIRVAYGEGMGRSRSGPASILSVVSPARPPTQ